MNAQRTDHWGVDSLSGANANGCAPDTAEVVSPRNPARQLHDTLLSLTDEDSVCGIQADEQVTDYLELCARSTHHDQ